VAVVGQEAMASDPATVGMKISTIPRETLKVDRYRAEAVFQLLSCEQRGSQLELSNRD
jgi:hypothetical protein